MVPILVGVAPKTDPGKWGCVLFLRDDACRSNDKRYTPFLADLMSSKLI